MPDFSLEQLNTDDELPLFPDSDPLTITLHDVDGIAHVFKCTDHPLLPDDRRLNLQSAPRAYLVATISGQLVEEDRKKATEVLHALFDASLVDVDKLMELNDFVDTQRDAARKRRAKERLRRPTGGQLPS